MTRLAIQNSRVTAVFLLVIFLAGIQTFHALPRAEDPGFTFRTAQVITQFPGASPERVEQLVTDKLEKAIQEIPELDYVKSTSKNGVSVVLVFIQQSSSDMRPLWDSLRRKVDRVRPELPDGIIGPTVQDEFGDVFGTVITLTGDGFSNAELTDVADDLKDELLLIPEVAKVQTTGTVDERVFVEYHNARLAELGLSPLQLKNILESRNIIIPGGSVTTGDERIVLEPTGKFESVEELRRTLISLPGRSEVVYLEDIAVVTRGYADPPRTLVRAGGAAGVAIAVSMRDGGNILTLGHAVRTLVERVRGFQPHGIELDYVQFQADVVDRKTQEFVVNLFQAIGIVIVVMLITLGLRTGLIVSALIPMAIVMSLMLMGVFGIGLDQMSLASLIIALGMLVDNAIVMSESILVEREAGKSALDAAVDSAAELKVPLLVSSLTTSAAFLPIFLAESETGEYTAPLFKVVTLTLLCSWFLSLTMTPLLCYAFMRVKKTNKDESTGRWTTLYRRLLVFGLRFRFLSVAAITLLFVVVMMGAGWVPMLFFPPNDRPTLTIELRSPTGTPIERSNEVAMRVEQFILEELLFDPSDPDKDGVTNWAGFIGSGAPRFFLSYAQEAPSPEYATFVVNASTRDAVDSLVPRFETFCFDSFPDVEATVRPLPVGPPVTNPIEVRISGRETDGVFAIVDSVKAKLRSMPGTRSVRDDWGRSSKKLRVRVDEARARRAGITNQDIAVSLQTNMSGLSITEYREGDKVIPVTLRSSLADRQDLGKIETLNVFSQLSGRSVPLKQVADVELAWQPAKIKRRRRLKTVTVISDLDPGVTATEVNRSLRPWLDEQRDEQWPRGYGYVMGGEAETSGDANASIVEKLPIAGLIILLLLVGQFNSIRRTTIVLATIPLSLIGVVIGLLIARSYFGFMTFLGVISLAGIVINNAIVLLDRIRIEIDDNKLAPADAVVTAAQKRMRPILLTTCTTIGGLLPLWLGGGPMWEPMAISIIFGLAFATVLTLGMVPVLYSILFRVSFANFER